MKLSGRDRITAKIADGIAHQADQQAAAEATHQARLELASSPEGMLGAAVLGLYDKIDQYNLARKTIGSRLKGLLRTTSAVKVARWYAGHAKSRIYHTEGPRFKASEVRLPALPSEATADGTFDYYWTFGLEDRAWGADQVTADIFFMTTERTSGIEDRDLHYRVIGNETAIGPSATVLSFTDGVQDDPALTLARHANENAMALLNMVTNLVPSAEEI